MSSEAEIAEAIRGAAVVLVSPETLTSPGPLAVAIRYDEETMDAPVVSCKTWRAAARYLMRLAREAGVWIKEDALAWKLDAVAVGENIPSDTYGPVAEVLAAVHGWQSQPTWRQVWGARRSCQEMVNWLPGPRTAEDSEPVVEKTAVVRGGRVLASFRATEGSIEHAVVSGRRKVRLIPLDRRLPGVEVGLGLRGLRAVLTEWLETRHRFVLFPAGVASGPDAGPGRPMLPPGQSECLEVEAHEVARYALRVVPEEAGGKSFPRLALRVASGPYEAARAVAISPKLDALLGRGGVLLGRFGLQALRTHFDNPWGGCLRGNLGPVGDETMACLRPADVRAFLEATRVALRRGRI